LLTPIGFMALVTDSRRPRSNELHEKANCNCVDGWSNRRYHAVWHASHVASSDMTIEDVLLTRKINKTVIDGSRKTKHTASSDGGLITMGLVVNSHSYVGLVLYSPPASEQRVTREGKLQLNGWLQFSPAMFIHRGTHHVWPHWSGH